MAFLSWAAYYDDVKGQPGNNIDQSEWILISDYSSPAHDEAEGYLATRGNVLALVFEGSTTPEDFAAAVLTQEEMFLALEGLVIQALAYAQAHPNITSIYVTGHSLGGAMAEWFAHKWAPTFAQTLDVSIATFGSPGTDVSSPNNSYVNNILQVGNTGDAIFNHSGLAGLIMDGANLLVRDGVSITVDLPNVSAIDDRLPFVDFFREHGAFLYERAMRVLAESVTGHGYLQSSTNASLVIDALISAADERPIDLSHRSDNLLILGGSGVAFSDNDTISSGSGRDTLEGGLGNDALYGGSGDDLLLGGVGNDTLSGGIGIDTLRGGPGNDLIDGGDDYDFLSYFDATSGVLVRLSISGPQNTGGSGIDTLIGIEAASGSPFGDTLVGTDNHDQFYGQAGNDSLVGLGGHDVFRGDAGNDTVDGGSGIDQMSYQYDAGAVRVDLAITGPQDTGGAGIDQLIGIEQVVGSAFNDTISGDGVGNLLSGFTGNDSLSGRAGNDTLFLGEGNDTGAGGDGDDYIDGDNGNDSVDGGSGNDTLIVGAGSDTAAGGAGNDFLSGGADADSLSGGDGSDTLEGASGNDVLAGGRGADVFIFGAGFGHDAIIDFRRIEDEIRFEGAGFADFADMMAHALQVGRHVVITNAAGDSLQLNNVLLSSLQSADFLFS